MVLSDVEKKAIEEHLGRPLFHEEDLVLEQTYLPVFKVGTPVKVVEQGSEYYGHEFNTGKALYCHPFYCWTVEIEPGIYVSERDLEYNGDVIEEKVEPLKEGGDD